MRCTYLPILCALCFTACGAMAQPLLLEPTVEEYDRKYASITSVTELQQIALEAKQKEDWLRLEAATRRLAQLLPQQPSYRFALAEAFALQDKKSEAYDQLLRLQREGLSFALAEDEDFAPIRGTQVFDHLVDGFESNARPYGRLESRFVVPDDVVLVEGLAAEPKTGALFLSSVAEGAIYKLAGSELETVASELGGVFEIAFSADGSTLWAATAPVPHAKDAAGPSALVAIDPTSGEIRQRYAAPAGALLAYLAVADSGAVFVSDVLGSAVYILRPGANELEKLFSAPAFPALRGLAVRPDGSQLFVADAFRGIASIDLESEESVLFTLGDKFSFAGIDDLVWFDDSLIFVQPGVQPQRVVRIGVSENGRRITQLVTLAASQPSFSAPSHLAMGQGDELLILSASQWPQFDPASGKAIANLPPIELLVTDATRGWKETEEPADAAEG